MNDVSISQVDWNSHREQLSIVRYEVFVVGQNVPVELEQDELDPICAHFLATVNEKPVGTARVDQTAHIGRVAVLESYQGRGIGSSLMELAVKHIEAARHPYALLNSQVAATQFYAKLGFEPHGVEFMEAGIAHVAMRKRLS